MELRGQKSKKNIWNIVVTFYFDKNHNFKDRFLCSSPILFAVLEGFFAPDILLFCRTTVLYKNCIFTTSVVENDNEESGDGF